MTRVAMILVIAFILFGFVRPAVKAATASIEKMQAEMERINSINADGR